MSSTNYSFLKGLGEDCNDDSDCYIDENNKQIITCQASKCVCKEGYVRQNNYCKGKKILTY